VTSASNSRDFEGRYELTGNNTVCSIRIKAVQIDEAGEWRCEVSDYDYLLYKRFEVQVAVKATTPTPCNNITFIFVWMCSYGGVQTS
jgi:hypothetical protein